MQNKPNFRNTTIGISSFVTSEYEILYRSPGQKTKPIQTQLKPIQSQFNPKQTQFVERGKNERFCVDKDFYDVYCDFLADFTTL